MIAAEGVEMPRRATKGSCGYDFYAPYDVELKPRKWLFFRNWTVIDTGVRLSLFENVNTTWLEVEMIKTGHNYRQDARLLNWFMLLVPRSGLGTKYGVRFRNTAGIIDNDYRDTIKLVLTSDKPVTIHKGERIAQGIVIPYGVFAREIVPTEERHGGHGSTGA